MDFRIKYQAQEENQEHKLLCCAPAQHRVISCAAGLSLCLLICAGMVSWSPLEGNSTELQPQNASPCLHLLLLSSGKLGSFVLGFIFKKDLNYLNTLCYWKSNHPCLVSWKVYCSTDCSEQIQNWCHGCPISGDIQGQAGRYRVRCTCPQKEGWNWTVFKIPSSSSHKKVNQKTDEHLVALPGSLAQNLRQHQSETASKFQEPNTQTTQTHVSRYSLLSVLNMLCWSTQCDGKSCQEELCSLQVRNMVS